MTDEILKKHIENLESLVIGTDEEIRKAERKLHEIESVRETLMECIGNYRRQLSEGPAEV